MEFDQQNLIVRLCSKGMELEGQGNFPEAFKLFQDAWNQATTDFEKFTAAHYLARHQGTAAHKLKWDEIALAFALRIENSEIKGTLPSLYLNIGKCFEDLKDFDQANKNYQLANSFVAFLPEDGYGNMIKSGIKKALERISHFY